LSESGSPQGGLSKGMKKEERDAETDAEMFENKRRREK